MTNSTDITNENPYELKISNKIQSINDIKRESTESVEMSESSSFPVNGKASNSCEACRRLKKKCSKDLPACKRCLERNLSSECFYPGKSRRRTKAEMEQYRLEHPEKFKKEEFRQKQN